MKRLLGGSDIKENCHNVSCFDLFGSTLNGKASIIIEKFLVSSVIEHRTVNARVRGLNPRRGAINFIL